MNCFDTELVLDRLKLFWQYPVITEKTFYEQNKTNANYMGIPWATIIDKKYNLTVIYNLLNMYTNKNVVYYTCCQHISFRLLLPLFKALNIINVYTPHKITGENCLNGVQLLPCPLYAVNYEDKTRNEMFNNIDFLNIKRDILYSFQGAYNPSWYLTDIRKRILEMKHPDNCYVKHIGNWHFDNVVYSAKQNNKYELNETDGDTIRTQKYNKLLIDSRYSLCPSGSGPNSIRFWEALAVGSIPILLADTLELPEHDLWDKAILRVSEKDLTTIPSVLSKITEIEEKERRCNCLVLYQFFTNNYINKSDTKLNLVVFSNCHGEKYLNLMKEHTNIYNVFNVNYIVSYDAINDFPKYEIIFKTADLLIINNIKNYKDFTLSHLKTILKPDAKVIVIPYVRFSGYWFHEPSALLKRIQDNSVSFFPNITLSNIDAYLNIKLDANATKHNFVQCMDKLKSIENECDVLFYDFFKDNHTKYPMFRDANHPTANIINFIGKQIIEKICEMFSFVVSDNYEVELKSDIREYGHYKPIVSSIASLLGLTYNLDTVFITTRRVFLTKVIEYETNLLNHTIKDLDDMKIKLFNNI
jgi:hypothetical protein